MLPSKNRILDSLPRREFAAIEATLEEISLRAGQSVHGPHVRYSYVYFPTTAVFSAITLMEDGSAVEIGTIGREGIVGFQVGLGADRSLHQTICQVPGKAFRMPAKQFQAHLEVLPGLREFTQRYTQCMISFLGQSVACNRLHTIFERCARWLLLTHDRVDGDEFYLTQEFLAYMLGVRRSGVSVAAGILQEAGAIAYRRGIVSIRDRAALEAATCECYRITTAEFERLLEV